MTRWVQEFEQQPFRVTWSALMEAVVPLDVDDKTVATTVDELARLKKVLVFVDRVIANADLELTPKSVWTNSYGQADACLQQVRSYSSNRNVAHLVQANEHADNILTYVRPYMVVPEQALEAYGAAVRTVTEQVSGYTTAFQLKALDAQRALAAAVEDASTRTKTLEAIEHRIKNFDEYLFDGTEGKDPAEKYVKEMVSEIESRHEAVESLHARLLVGTDSTSERIAAYEKQVNQMRDALTSLLGSATLEHKELQRFYERIFGPPPADDDEVREGGLKEELDARLVQLGKFEIEQRTRHDALFNKIESLLPGATSAGLATAYKTLKDDFKAPIKKYTQAFYASLAVLLLGGLAVVSDSVTLWPFHVQFVEAGDWEQMLRTLLTRAPIIVPVVWIAIFSATRRSQYERLQQEYAHKEALASSYESYKKQLQDLHVETDALQKELIAKAIDAIAYNASKTLDGHHTEKLPAMQVLEALKGDELKKIIDSARGK